MEAEKAALAAEKEQLVNEKELLRTDEQGLAMERETWQSEIEEQQQEALQASMTASNTSIGAVTPLDPDREQEWNAKIEKLTAELRKSRTNFKKLKLQFQAKSSSAEVTELVSGKFKYRICQLK